MDKATFERRLKLGNAIMHGLTLFITGVVIAAVLVTAVKLLWGWVVPDLFPRSVEQGLIAGDLSWLTALKLIILVGVLTAGGRLLAIRSVWAGDLIGHLKLRQMRGTDRDE